MLYGYGFPTISDSVGRGNGVVDSITARKLCSFLPNRFSFYNIRLLCQLQPSSCSLLTIICACCLVMPRDVCSVYGCATARSHGYGIFRVSLFDDTAQQIWREKLANIFGPRVGGEQFVDLLNEGRAMICEKHFKDADVLTIESKKWKGDYSYCWPYCIVECLISSIVRTL